MSVRMPSKSERLPVALLAVVALVWLSFYVHFARRAWFFQDDFIFLERYSSSPRLSETLEISAVVRPLSQNLYWYLGQKILGRTAQAFFLANLCNVLLTSTVVGLLFARRHGLVAALGSSLIYLSCPPVFLTFVWISNSQHLIPHLIVAGFLYVLFRRSVTDEQLSWKRASILILMLFAAAAANALALLVIGAVVADMASRRATWRQHLPELTVIAVGCALICTMYGLTSAARGGVYRSQFTLDRLLTNGEFYFGSRPLLAFWAIAMTMGAAFGVVRRRPLEAALYSMSLVLYLPFAFLQYQAYYYYAALPIVLALLALWETTFRLLTDNPMLTVAAATALAMWALVAYSGGSLKPPGAINQMAEHPAGLAARSYIAQLDQIVADRGWRDLQICFTSSSESTQPQGEAHGAFASEWAHVGLGKAFTMFAKERNQYRYVFADQDSAGCEALLMFSLDGRLIPVAN